jgi:hypothetical protein
MDKGHYASGGANCQKDQEGIGLRQVGAIVRSPSATGASDFRTDSIAEKDGSI